jgi:hypothetical protein
MTVCPGHRYCENSRTEPLEDDDQDQVSFLYPLGNDYVGPDAVSETGWRTATISSADYVHSTGAHVPGGPIKFFAI